uniref:Uncharacterized protein n=1 Tax=Nelumbo nucifera TaxID=4432 RepID=A0A822XFB7_NELNU|nr:TPA_asm: hypothetical protein HUJ06_021627 [Nelumbo nucifera]
MPTLIWKLLRWLNVGREKKLAKAREIADLNIANCISVVRQELLRGVETHGLLSSYIRLSKTDDEFLRDTTLNFLVAGRDTIASVLSWFIWLTSRTPRVEAKILEKLRLKYWVFDPNDLRGLVYLHAACCESLRLYPPLPMNRKVVIKNDVLPDGNCVRPGMQILVSTCALGRMPWM